MVADGSAPTEGEDGDGPTDRSDDGADTAEHDADGRSGDAGAPGTTDEAGDNTDGEHGPTDEEVVATASDAAEGVLFSRYRRSDVRDVDVAVSYEDGLLEVDVYLNVPDADDEERVDEEAEQVADDAALAAIQAVDRLFEERGE